MRFCSMSQNVGGDVLQIFSLDVEPRAAAILVGALEADDLMCETPRGKKLSFAEALELTPDQTSRGRCEASALHESRINAA